MGYKTMMIPKRTGGFRKLEEPDPVLKGLQRALNRIFKKLYAFPDFVTGSYGANAGTHNTGKFHVNAEDIYKFDIADFFGSCTTDMVYNALAKHMDVPKVTAAAIANFCTYMNHLPQGAPTSPFLANLCAVDLHTSLKAYMEAIGGEYSIYVDDMYCSGPLALGLTERLPEILQIIRDSGFTAKAEKIKQMKRGRKQQVMDICVAGCREWAEDAQHTRLSKIKRHHVFCAIHNLKVGLSDAYRKTIGLVSNAKRVGDQGYTKMKEKLVEAIAAFKARQATVGYYMRSSSRGTAHISVGNPITQYVRMSEEDLARVTSNMEECRNDYVAYLLSGRRRGQPGAPTGTANN